MPADQMTQFVAVAQVTQESLAKSATGETPADPRKASSEYVRTREFTLPAAICYRAASTGCLHSGSEHGARTLPLARVSGDGKRFHGRT
jgi:PiT family inorganic phosphate transporter